MHRLQVACDGGERTIIVRIEQHGLLGTNSDDEVRGMQAMHAFGYPVAEVLGFETSSELLGQPFFVMEFLPGSSVYVPESLEEYVRKLDALHRIDPAEAGMDFLPQPEGARGSALLQVERWYEVYRDSLAGPPSPLVEEAAQWLRNNAPETGRVCIVHGDPGPGNYLHVDGKLSAVVDWEFVHLGDADEDWAYLISMRGMGVMSEDAWVDYLREKLGVALEAERLRYWKALNFFKGVCLDQTALDILMRGDSLAPNLLAIGGPVHLSALKRLATTIL
jgi:aminoglycoside phosphotransferase (APT) family kinase protein